MTSTIVRIADPVADAPDLLEIYRHAVHSNIATFEETAPTLQEFQARIENVLTTHPWLVADLEGVPVGYAYASQHRPRAGYRWTAEVSAYVSDRVAGSGIGTRLYAALIDVLKLQGYKNLLAIISTPNVASEALHKKFGFEKAGSFHGIGFKFGAWHETCWWQAKIGQLDKIPNQPAGFEELRYDQRIHELLHRC